MKVQFYKPRNDILRKYIDGYYFIAKNEPLEPLRYWSFPNNYCIATVCQDAAVISEKDSITISPSASKKIASDLYYNNSLPVKVCFERPVNEITVYFKPLGIFHFWDEIKFEPRQYAITDYQPYSDYIIEMEKILNIEERELQIVQLEQYWLSKYKPKDLQLIEAILNDIENNLRISEIADKFNMSRQYLHKMFFRSLGKSPAEYRKTHRFKSIIDNYKTEKKFTELSYNNSFFDQPHFNKNFKELTGVNPSSFFNNVDTTDSNFWLFV